jgi:tRNA threonylcarbamoyl adenosine modification protein YjeE
MKLATEAETAAFGASLARAARRGDVITLSGSLGAGKTALARGFIAAVGHQGDVPSPSFAIVQPYEEIEPPVWHVDLYRIEKARELDELGLEEFLGDPSGICVVEWADKFSVMPKDHLRIELAHTGDTRSIALTGTGPRSLALASAITSELLQTER